MIIVTENGHEKASRMANKSKNKTPWVFFTLRSMRMLPGPEIQLKSETISKNQLQTNRFF